MKLKQLASALQEVPAFAEPDYELEQYKTGAELAAQIIFAVESSFGDFGGKIVLDLGCGTGILGIGAALMGAETVIMCDCDPTALRQASETNAEEFELPLEFVHTVVGDDGRLPLRAGAVVDTVIMNPPFGTRRAGADVAFLKAAIHAVSPNDGAVYSLHKSSTRAHLIRTAETLGVGCSIVAQLKFDIPATYAFHTADSLDVDVDLLRFVKGPAAAGVAAAHSSIPPYVPSAGSAAAAASRGGGGHRGRGRGASAPARGGRGGRR